MYVEILKNIMDIIKEDDFLKRKKELENQKSILLNKIKEEKNNVKYVVLLITLNLELRLENEYIKKEQNNLFDLYSTSWKESDVALWKINYAGFLFEEEKEDEQALKILEELDMNLSEYAEKYSIMGQIYYIKEDFQKAEECFKKATDLCEKNIFLHKYIEYVLAYAKCLYMNRKYEEVAYILEANIKEVKWNDEIDIEMNAILFMTYLKLKYEEKSQIRLSEIKKHKVEIENIKDDEYFDEIINYNMEPEGISICPYSYCPRHFMMN